MPPDPTDPEDMIHVTLLSGELLDSLGHAHRLDRWLSGHLADFMQAIQLIENDADEEWVLFSSACQPG